MKEMEGIADTSSYLRTIHVEDRAKCKNVYRKFGENLRQLYSYFSTVT